MRLDEETKERLRNLTVEVLLEIRSAHLRTGTANVLRHWDQMQDRLRAAARTSVSVESFSTELARSMRVSAPSVSHANAVRALADDVRDRGCQREWLDLIEEEWGYLMAQTRCVAETRKENRNVDA